MNRYTNLLSFEIKVSNLKNIKTLKKEDNVFYINDDRINGRKENVSRTFLIKQFDKLKKEGYFLVIDDLEKYKDFLNVDIKRHYGIAYEIQKYCNKKWTFQKNSLTINYSEFLGIMKINFPEVYEHFEILFRYFKYAGYKSLKRYYKSFICEQIELSKFDFSDLHKTDKRGTENITKEHLKIWIGYYTITDSQDLNTELLIKLTNWVMKDEGLAVLLSDLPNAGLGLFTSKKILPRQIVCDYGGKLTSHIEKKEDSFYLLTNGRTDDPIFFDWNFDAKLFFRINQVGRYINDPGVGNAQYEVEDRLFGLPYAHIVATEEIEPYSEIYIVYGPNYKLPEEVPAAEEPSIKRDEKMYNAIVATINSDKYTNDNLNPDVIYKVYENYILNDTRIEKFSPDYKSLARKSDLNKISLSRWETFWRNVLKKYGMVL